MKLTEKQLIQIEKKYSINLRELQQREWNEKKIYNSILVYKNRKHDSGYATMYIIGVNNDGKAEIASDCSDSIHWSFDNKLNYNTINTDMFFPTGIIRFFSRYGVFEVGPALSDIDIKLIKKI